MKRASPPLRALPLLAAGAVAAGCGGNDPGPPADVHGSYTISITDGPSTCNLPNWVQGQATAGIPVTISQTGSSVTSAVGGLAGAYLNATLGASTFTGTVSGAELDLTLHGTKSLLNGACTYTIDGRLTGTSSGDVLRGFVLYSPNTNNSADCAGIGSCSARQDFNGTRPPTGG